jgi:hypothetical protein
LLTNTYNEFANNEDQFINGKWLNSWIIWKRYLFKKLAVNSSKDQATIAKQANY